MTLYKILKYVALALGVIGLVLLGRLLATGDDAIVNSGDVQASVVDPMLYVTYIVFAIVVVLVLIFVIKGLFSGNIKNTLIPVGVFAVVLLIAYMLGDATPMYDRNNVQTIDASGSKWVDAGLFTFYILAAVAILVMLFSGVKKIMK